MIKLSKDMKKKTISVCIDKWTLEKLNNLSIIYHRSKSSVIEWLIEKEYNETVSDK